MKAFVISVTILALSIILLVFASLRANALLKDFSSTLGKSTPSDSLAGYEEIVEKYESIKPFLVLFTYEEDLREIESQLSDIRSAAESKDSAAFICAKNRLALQIDQLRRFSIFSYEAIF